MVSRVALFSRDYSDIPKQLLDYSNDTNMLQAISDYAKAADLGIESMQFEIDSKEVKDDLSFPENMPEGVKAALTQFMHILSETSSNSETRLKMNEVKATSKHQGINAKGKRYYIRWNCQMNPMERENLCPLHQQLSLC